VLSSFNSPAHTNATCLLLFAFPFVMIICIYDRFFNKPKNASDLSSPGGRRVLESNIDSGGQYHSINVTYWTFQAAAK
jgi:hypothetical protein